MPCMFCVKIWMCSSSAFIGLYLLFLIESKIGIKHAYDNFCTVLVYCVEHGRVIKSTA
jgi:hypothetical protein